MHVFVASSWKDVQDLLKVPHSCLVHQQAVGFQSKNAIVTSFLIRDQLLIKVHRVHNYFVFCPDKLIKHLLSLEIICDFFPMFVINLLIFDVLLGYNRQVSKVLHQGRYVFMANKGNNKIVFLPVRQFSAFFFSLVRRLFVLFVEIYDSILDIPTLPLSHVSSSILFFYVWL